LRVAYSSYSVVTAATANGPGFKLAWGERYFLFSMWVQRILGRPNLLYDGYCLSFPGVKWSGRCA